MWTKAKMLRRDPHGELLRRCSVDAQTGRSAFGHGLFGCRIGWEWATPPCSAGVGFVGQASSSAGIYHSMEERLQRLYNLRR